MKRRPDIDGLRALAIVPVVLFHARVPGFSGGFVGVDVFFVISGYLICGLIARELDRGEFSLLTFYERRIRRIFPALFAVLLVTSIASAVILLPRDREAYAHSLVATALFGSNFLFWSQTGYFDGPAAGKPLLHGWSLAVEEQFYIGFPLLLLAIRRLPRPRWRLLIAAIAVTSFAIAMIELPEHPSAAFYLPLARAWELLLGALAALGAFPRIERAIVRELLAWSGLALIAVAVVVFSPATGFPGAAALVPCVGAVLLLHTDETALSGRLGCRPLRFVGLVSYSWYLWHWPMLVLARHHVARELTGYEIAAVLAGSALIAVASWRFVERPFRRPAGASGSRTAIFAGAGAAIVVTVVVGIVLPLVGRGDDAARPDYRDGTCFLAEDQRYADWAGAGCLIDHHARQTVLIWGDSFAAHYIPGLLADREASANYLQLTAYSCPPVLGVSVPWAPHCHDFVDHVRDVLDRFEVGTVVLAARWERYWNRSVTLAQLQATVAELAARHLRVVIVEQGPSFDFDSPAEYVARTGREAARSRDPTAINRELLTLTGVAAFFDPARGLCAETECDVRRDGRFLYWDAGHYSADGSRLAARALVRLLWP